ncbi:uncharacterized protein NECHADRAFT_83568 [Fusarium vanettenii 77-13-4]|uniref:Heterokaryon incompatibility domain-containing protein n=1 Tax=Fusarium vanettenii (strain ATCC MYA-4622 / CBS 123669 / FGSC 9596 / NRRL 45880 / 77-13-4) TaxID=660122 RepID=C7YY50_FUSV7|nr:uncharacterized protein NECHADRAFT_83568 [Fusarium vanettenii 77-13-4]EEU43131.1 hypothetical protein NECHADRAFT_83568 [Fusarium vanettenii 77-13-4]
MPTRLIDIGEKGEHPKLIEVDGKLMDYLALSHRWGGAKIYQTTQANLKAQTAGIDLESLCITFWDALNMTSRLGYQCIWIDSLCIVQDSPKDWAKEAARMDMVYMNAVLTLAAACATSGDTGLFQQRNPVRVRMGYQGPSTDNMSNSPEKYYFLEETKIQSFREEVTNGYLNSRGWCLQERWLSRRTVHFGRTQRFWECQSTMTEERFPGGKGEHRGYLKALSSSTWNADAFRAVRGRMEFSEFGDWYNTVCEYNNRDLTVGDDKFPAISGVASIFGSHRKDRYLAGLWEGYLQVGLLWCSEDGKGLRRPSTFRAPSWSWASCDGCIYFEFDWDGEVELDIITSSTTLAGQDPYGKISAGSIEANGFLEKIPNISPITTSESAFVWTNVNAQLFDVNGKLVGEGSLDTPERLNTIGQLFCLMIFRVAVGFRPLPLEILNTRVARGADKVTHVSLWYS